MSNRPVITFDTSLAHASAPGARAISKARKYIHIIGEEKKPEAYPGAPVEFIQARFINYEDDQMTSVTCDGLRILMFNNPTISQCYDLAAWERECVRQGKTASQTVDYLVNKAKESHDMTDRYCSDLSYLHKKLQRVEGHPQAPGIYERTGALCECYFCPHSLEFDRKDGGTHQIAERHCVVLWDGHEVRMLSTGVFEETYTTPQGDKISRHELPRISFSSKGSGAAGSRYGQSRFIT